MKTNILFRFAAIITLVLLINAAVQGQATQTVLVGSTYHYTVTQSMTSGTSTFAWTNSATALQATNTPVLGSGLTNTIQVNWLQAGTYTITVLETSSNSCSDPGSPKTMIVTVNPNTGTIQFASTSSAACSGATATNLDLALTLGGNYTYPIVVNYTVNGTAHSRTINSGTTISLGSEDNILNNATTTDALKSVVITSATCSGATITVGANSTYSYTAWGTPSTGGITAY
jgi:hypothetical protein